MYLCLWWGLGTGGCDGPVVLVAVVRVRAGGVEEQAGGAGGGGVLGHVGGPPGLEGGFVGDGVGEGGGGVAVAEGPADLEGKGG